MLSRYNNIKDQEIQSYFDHSVGAIHYLGNEVLDIDNRQPWYCSLGYSRIHPITSGSKHSRRKHL